MECDKISCLLKILLCLISYQNTNIKNADRCDKMGNHQVSGLSENWCGENKMWTTLMNVELSKFVNHTDENYLCKLGVVLYAVARGIYAQIFVVQGHFKVSRSLHSGKPRKESSWLSDELQSSCNHRRWPETKNKTISTSKCILLQIINVVVIITSVIKSEYMITEIPSLIQM